MTDWSKGGAARTPYLIAKIDFIRRDCVGRFDHRLAPVQIPERGEAIRRDGLEKCQ